MHWLALVVRAGIGNGRRQNGEREGKGEDVENTFHGSLSSFRKRAIDNNHVAVTEHVCGEYPAARGGAAQLGAQLFPEVIGRNHWRPPPATTRLIHADSEPIRDGTGGLPTASIRPFQKMRSLSAHTRG